jgi:hypothetical protein
MSKRWTAEEDGFLLTYHGVGADFVASHDLGRPDGAGERRLKKLTESGARVAFAKMVLADIEFNSLAGRKSWNDAQETLRWENEVNESALGMT